MDTAAKRPPPEHVGWDLWRATAAWKRRFTREMLACGHLWYGEARGNLIQHIPRHGVAQTALVKRTGLSKQAVQQLLDELVHDGIVRRRPDPADARRKLIAYTRAGSTALDDADEIKRAIENEYRAAMGAPALRALKGALAVIIATEDGVD